MKRIPPKWWLRLINGWGAGLTAFLSTVGFFGVVRATIAGTEISIPIWTIVVVGGACLTFGFIIAYVRGSMKMLPDSFIGEVGSDGPYKCMPATSATLQVACELTRPYYAHEFVEYNLAEQWRMKNPPAFECIMNSDNEVCAAFGILPVERGFMEFLIEGRVDDPQLQAKDIMEPSATDECMRLYISGVVVRDAGKMIGHKRARVMLWAMLEHLKRVYGLKRTRELYAISVTKEAEKLMRKLKFELVAEATGRRDRCRLFKYVLTQESWEKLLCEVGDCSRMCSTP